MISEENGPVKSGLPPPQRGSEPENETNINDCIKRLMENDPNLMEINLNNMKRVPLLQMQQLLYCVKDNTQLKKLTLANMGLTDSTGMEYLIDALQHNKTLESINLETNCLTGDVLLKLFQAALVNQCLQECKVVNQSSPMNPESERQVVDLICKNTGLLKCSVTLRLADSRNKVDRSIMRNIEIKRVQRKQQESGGSDAEDEIKSQKIAELLNMMVDNHIIAYDDAKYIIVPNTVPDEIVQCGLPEQMRPNQSENETNITECIKRLLENDPTLTEINLNNLKRTPIPTLKKLLEAIKSNKYLKKLSLANMSLFDHDLEPLNETLKCNTTLETLNLETNYLSGKFFKNFFLHALFNQTLREITVSNQHPSATVSTEEEKEIVESICGNQGLTKCSIKLRFDESRHKLDQTITRNIEIRRLKRKQEVAASKVLAEKPDSEIKPMDGQKYGQLQPTERTFVQTQPKSSVKESKKEKSIDQKSKDAQVKPEMKRSQRFGGPPRFQQANIVPDNPVQQPKPNSQKLLQNKTEVDNSGLKQLSVTRSMENNAKDNSVPANSVTSDLKQKPEAMIQSDQQKPALSQSEMFPKQVKRQPKQLKSPFLQTTTVPSKDATNQNITKPVQKPQLALEQSVSEEQLQSIAGENQKQSQSINKQQKSTPQQPRTIQFPFGSKFAQKAMQSDCNVEQEKTSDSKPKGTMQQVHIHPVPMIKIEQPLKINQTSSNAKVDEKFPAEPKLLLKKSKPHFAMRKPIK